MLKNCSKMARKKTEGKYPIEIVDDVFAEGNVTLADVLKAAAPRSRLSRTRTSSSAPRGSGSRSASISRNTA